MWCSSAGAKVFNIKLFLVIFHKEYWLRKWHTVKDDGGEIKKKYLKFLWINNSEDDEVVIYREAIRWNIKKIGD